MFFQPLDLIYRSGYIVSTIMLAIVTSLAFTSKSDNEMVNNSKRAIIETGISESYFKKHFRLASVVDTPSDRRVEWIYSINEYETHIIDEIGFYTSDAGQRVYIHGIRDQLYSTYDIKKTIPKRTAYKIMEVCIGKFSDDSIRYETLAAPGKAKLYLTAKSLDVVKSSIKGMDEGRSFDIGFVDLESGKCTKRRGMIAP